jgi:cell division septation protein DedD
MFPADKLDAPVDTEVPGGPEFEPVFRRQPKKRGRLWLSLSYLVLVGLAIGGSWYYFTGKPVNDDGSYVPIIRANLDPVKVRPAKPGGMEVPNQDKLVYERLQGGRAKPRVERLLPPAEKPLPPPVLNIETAAGTPEPGPKSKPGKQAAAKAGGEGKASSPASAKPKLSVATAPSKPLAKTPTTKDVLAARKPPLPENMGPAAATTKGAADRGRPGDGEAYRVQLAAVRSLDRVNGEWERLRGKNKDLLGTLSLTVSKTDLGPKKGIFYRLRVGPLVDEIKARDLCRKLAARKVGCLIVRPGK